MNKQQEQVRMGVYFFNGAYRPFAGYPKSIKVWNSRVTYQGDYLGTPSSVSLSGLGKANPSGYRPFVNIMLDNSTGTQADAIRRILNRLGNQYDRQVYPETTTFETLSADSTTTTFTIDDASLPAQDNFFNRCIAYNGTADESRVITAYSKSGSVGTFTVDETISWGNGDSINIIAKPNLPSYLGVSTDDTNGNVIYCMVEASQLGAVRELTIANSIVSLTLKGRERVNIVPEKVII